MLDFDLFAKNIEDAVTPRSIGFTYAIYDGLTLKKSGKGGLARFTKYSSLQQNPQFKMNCCSLSKTITAAAALKAIRLRQRKRLRNGSAITDPMAVFLPKSWIKGIGVSQLRFVDLLSHNSGLLPNGDQLDADLYSNLKISVALGRLSPIGGYQNINYSLFRIIIPYLILPPAAIVALEASPASQYTLGAVYASFVREEILNPCGVYEADIRPVADPPTVRYYNFYNKYDSVEDQLDPAGNEQIYRCGESYWYMSAIDYGAFLAGLRQGKADLPLVPSDPIGQNISIWGQMKADSLGLFRANSFKLSPYYFHDGAFHVDSAGEQTSWVAFPNNVTAVLMINSYGGLSYWTFPSPGTDLSAGFNPSNLMSNSSPGILLMNAHDASLV
ncbi:MAG: serine hydrolase domain-containing protein [Byssovorax sp.]